MHISQNRRDYRRIRTRWRWKRWIDEYPPTPDACQSNIEISREGVRKCRERKGSRAALRTRREKPKSICLREGAEAERSHSAVEATYRLSWTYRSTVRSCWCTSKSWWRVTSRSMAKLKEYTSVVSVFLPVPAGSTGLRMNFLASWPVLIFTIVRNLCCLATNQKHSLYWCIRENHAVVCIYTYLCHVREPWNNLCLVSHQTCPTTSRWNDINIVLALNGPMLDDWRCMY